MQEKRVYACIYAKKVVILHRKHKMIDVQKIWLTDTAIWIQTADGRKASEKFADYASLRNASKQEREDYSCSPFGVHWPRLDEDLSYEGFFAH